jgi:mono/diheme cytochrome c family protein
MMVSPPAPAIAGGTAAQEVIMSRRFRLALLAVAGIALAPSVFAQTASVKKEPVKPINDVAGGATFSAYCTVCHGVAGRGDGPAAKALSKPPADLTQIARKHDGKFPAAAVREVIIGETAPMAHGTRDMPMWGPLFRSTDGNVAELRLKNLIDYLASIQAK